MKNLHDPLPCSATLLHLFVKNGRIKHVHRNLYSKILSCINRIYKEYRKVFGENVWSSRLENEIQFHESLDEVEERKVGSPLYNFKFSDLQKEKLLISFTLESVFERKLSYPSKDSEITTEMTI